MTQRTVRELLGAGEPSFSFEFFPPRTDEDEAVLWRAIREIEPLQPTFVDITYGAGGSRRDRTLRTVERVLAETDLTVVAHLTCVGATREEIVTVIRRFKAAGVRNILALRGDPPDGPTAEWEATEGGLARTEELVALLGEVGQFCVGIAAYPQPHRESPDEGSGIKHFIQKGLAGADFAITQFFYSSADYFRFVEAARDLGCDLPILPGVMPVTSVRQVERFPELSGAPFPEDLAERLRAVADDPGAVRAVGVDFATNLCRQLLAGGAPGIHFYTLNRSTATREIHARLHTS